MKRYLEIGIVLMVCALVVSMTSPPDRTSESEPSPPHPVHTPSTSRPPSSLEAPSSATALALNNVCIGDDVDQLESQLGPPDFTWPKRMTQQWEPRPGNFTRIAYRTDDQGKRTVTGVEASGTLTRGNMRLVGFADSKAMMLKNLGEPSQVERGVIFHYPGLSISCNELVGLISLGDE